MHLSRQDRIMSQFYVLLYLFSFKQISSTFEMKEFKNYVHMNVLKHQFRLYLIFNKLPSFPVHLFYRDRLYDKPLTHTRTYILINSFNTTDWKDLFSLFVFLLWSPWQQEVEDWLTINASREQKSIWRNQAMTHHLHSKLHAA